MPIDGVEGVDGHRRRSILCSYVIDNHARVLSRPHMSCTSCSCSAQLSARVFLPPVSPLHVISGRIACRGSRRWWRSAQQPRPQAAHNGWRWDRAVPRRWDTRASAGGWHGSDIRLGRRPELHAHTRHASASHHSASNHSRHCLAHNTHDTSAHHIHTSTHPRSQPPPLTTTAFTSQ